MVVIGRRSSVRDLRCARPATIRVPARYARDEAPGLRRVRAGERDHLPMGAPLAPRLAAAGQNRSPRDSRAWLPTPRILDQIV